MGILRLVCHMFSRVLLEKTVANPFVFIAHASRDLWVSLLICESFLFKNWFIYMHVLYFWKNMLFILYFFISSSNWDISVLGSFNHLLVAPLFEKWNLHVGSLLPVPVPFPTLLQVMVSTFAGEGNFGCLGSWCFGKFGRYTPENQHGAQKSPNWKGKSSSRPPFLGSKYKMLIFPGSTLKNLLNLSLLLYLQALCHLA